MGGKDSGKPRISYEATLEEINELLVEIQGQLEAAHNKMNTLAQRVLYYTKTVSNRH
jgi:uncharacterized coiled-coil protein SlyX